MESLSFSFQPFSHTKLKNFLRGSASASMLSVFIFIFTAVYLSGHLSLTWTLLCVAIYFLMVQLKFLQSNNDLDEPPCIAAITTMRIIYNQLKNRQRSKTLMIEFLVGSCLLYTKEGMHMFTIATKKFLLLYDPNAVDYLLCTKRILRKGFLVDTLKSWMKQGINLSDGKKWQTRRKLLTPAFRLKILKEFFPVFNKHANVLVRRIDKLIEKQEVIDISLQVSSCAFDAVTETVLGKRDSQEYQNKEAAKAFQLCGEMAGRRSVSPWLWNDFIFNRTKNGKISAKCLDFLSRYVKGAMDEAKRRRLEQLNNEKINGVIPSNDDVSLKPKHKFCLLDFLLDLNLKDGVLTPDGVEEELNTFIVAAYDTSHTTVSWVLYLLGLHEDIQKKVQEELDMIFGEDIDRTVTFEDIQKLKYLNCVVKETLRLYPTVPFTSRVLDEDTVINGYKIRKGVNIIIPIYVLHRNTEIFPNPEAFIPDRFNQLNPNNRNGYIAFGRGPRNCIGQNSAIYQVTIVVASVLRHFTVTAVEQRDKITLSFDVILKSANGIRLKFTKRSS